MSKVYIPTINVGKAHDADIYCVAISKDFTITASGDGYLKFWSNKSIDKKLKPSYSILVNPVGLHHVDFFQTVESGKDLFIITCVAFNGQIYFYKFDNNDTNITDEDDSSEAQDSRNVLKEIDLLGKGNELKKQSFWAIKWVKSDDLVISHRLAATDIKGNTYIWRLNIPKEHTESDEISDEVVKELNLELQGTVTPQRPQFAMCVDISTTQGLLATGFNNGTVQVVQLSTLRPLYTFEGFGIQSTEQHSNCIRAINFSPGGKLLAVANDSGSYGCITLYETEFGERIGNLTVPTHSSVVNGNVNNSNIQQLSGENTNSSFGMFAHNGWVFGLNFNPSGELLVSSGYDSKLRIWDVKKRERVCTINITAGDIENEDEIMLEDENGESLQFPPIFDVKFFGKGIRGGMGNETNEGICCVCMDRTIRWYREAGGNN